MVLVQVVEQITRNTSKGRFVVFCSPTAYSPVFLRRTGQNARHQGGTNAFRLLTYKEQALSINGTIANLEKAVRYHAKFGSGQTGRKEQEILMNRARQVERLLERLRRDTKK